MNYQKVIEILKNPNASGGMLAEALGWSTANFAFIAGQFQDCCATKPKEWIDIRMQESVKSDNKATMLWEATDNGIHYKHYKIELDKYQTILGTLHKLINIRLREEKESRN